MPVPWKEPLAVAELGLWSMLSTAAVVKSFRRNFDGHTASSIRKRLQIPFVTSEENCRSLS